MMNVSYCVFFFQAEDGIRDLVRSRGLGDVYKRQGPYREERSHHQCANRVEEHLDQAEREGLCLIPGPVSYTHLTLPTSDLV